MSRVVVLAAAGATQVSGSQEEAYSTTSITSGPAQGSVPRLCPDPRPCTCLRNLSVYLRISGDFWGV